MTQQVSRDELLAEAQRRGLVAPSAQAAPSRAELIAEAQRRGLVRADEPQTQELLTPEEFSAINQQLAGKKGIEQAASETGAGEAFLASTGRQFAKLGRTARTGLAKIGEDDVEALAQIERERIAEQQAFAPLERQRPISTTAGEIAGAIAATAPIGGPAAGLATKATMGLAPRLAPVLGFAAAGAVEEQLLEGNPLLGAMFGAGGGVLINAAPKVLKAVYTKLTGKGSEQLSDIPEEIIVRLQQSGLSMEDIGKAAEDLLRKDFDIKLSPQAQARQARAGEFGAELTSAQATKDFELQQAEDLLRKSGAPEGTEAIRIRSEQEQALLKGAEEKVLQPFESTLTTNLADKADNFNQGEIGRIVRNSLKELKTRDKKVVTNLYSAAAEIEGENISIVGDALIDTFQKNADFSGVSDTTRNALFKNLANFGVAGEVIEKKGKSTVVDFDGEKITFFGDVKDLTLDNAEELRQRINAVSTSNASDTRLKVSMLDRLDGLVAEAVDGIPEGQIKKEAFERARNASSAFKTQFESKDIIDRLLTYGDLKGTVPKVTDEQVLNQFVRGSQAAENTRKLKQALLTSPTPQSRQAWSDFQFTAMEDFLKRSMDRTTDATGNVVNVLSGNRLASNLEKLGAEQVKLIFGPEMTATLKRLTQVVGDATIPVKGAINPSESGTRVANTFRRFMSLLTDMTMPGGGARAEIGNAIAKDKMKQEAQDQLTDALLSVKGKKIPMVEADSAMTNWLDTLATISERTQGLQIPAKGVAGATFAPENE